MEFLPQLMEFMLHITDHLADLLEQYGTLIYAILFAIIFAETGLVVMPFLPGDSLLFAVGAVTAGTGKLDIELLVPLLILAALLGDNVNYSVGRVFGRKIKQRERVLFLKKDYIDRTEHFYAKYGGRTIVMARFVPIVRTMAPFVAGAGSMAYWRYISFCIAGAVLWVGGLLMLGYEFGALEVVKRNFDKVILAITILSISPLVHQFFAARKVADSRI